MRTSLRYAFTILLLAVAAVAARAQVAWPTAGWQVATPESQGMDSHALQALVDFGGANQMDSLVVVRNGRIVAEAYYAPFGPDNLHAINSATKGVLAGLVGIAIAQGILPGADVPLVQLFPDYLKEADARKRAVTLQHLLDMTSGLDWKEPLSDAVPETMLQMTRERNWARFVAERPMATAPGEVFNYNSGNSHLASAILSQKAGMSTEAFAARHLFEPLGIRRWRWNKDPAGVPIGGWGLYLQTRDMARIGLLYLQRGAWDGRQLIPRAWVEKVFQPRIPMNLSPGRDFRYADSWWGIPDRRVSMAVGYNRQLIVVLPQQGVVAAMTARRNYGFEQMLDLLQRAVKSDAPLPEDAQAQQALAERIARAAQRLPEEASPAPAGQRIAGRLWTAAANDIGLRALQVTLDGQPQVELQFRNGKATYALGPDGTSAWSQGPRGLTLAWARWLGDGSLLVQMRLVEEGGTASYRLRPEGERLAVEYEYSSTGYRIRFGAEAAH